MAKSITVLEALGVDESLNDAHAQAESLSLAKIGKKSLAL